MKISEIYMEAVRLGRLYDPRGRGQWKYEDSSILFVDADVEVQRVLVGIDIEVGEILLADRLRQIQGVDLLIAHHPEGGALANLHKVMQLQVDLLCSAGMDLGIARQMVEERKIEVQRRISPINHMRTVDTAKLLNLPLICLHTPADNHVAYFLQELFEKRKPESLYELVKLLEKLPEYSDAKRNNAGPRIILGNPNSSPGKILMEMTGGTEGSKQAFKQIAKKGVKTLVSMHMGEENFREAKEVNLNVVIAGHISSDNLGLNLLLDGIQQKGKFKVTGCSGFRRYNHNLIK